MFMPTDDCQGLKSDPGNLAVRDFREASGTVSHGETVNPFRNRKSGDGNPSPTARRARFSIPTARYVLWEPEAGDRLRRPSVRVATSSPTRPLGALV
jgi:hypothetical protein